MPINNRRQAMLFYVLRSHGVMRNRRAKEKEDKFSQTNISNIPRSSEI